MPEWTVLLEIVPTVPVPRADVQCLLDELAALDPVAMVSDDRYALQLRVADGEPDEALTAVMSTWRMSAERLFFTPATVVRAEVMTCSELEHDIRAAVEGAEVLVTTHRGP